MSQTSAPNAVSIRLIEPIGAGGYADIWRGEDRLGRTVAVKIIRASMGDAATVEEQAKALARVSHRNVVTVYGLEEVKHPQLPNPVLAIIMEYVEGPTLTSVMQSAISLEEARRIGLSILDGIQAIHSVNLAHGDLHTDNVIVSDSDVKLIDLLYVDTLAALSTMPREAKLHRDLKSVRLILRDLLMGASLDDATVADFGRRLKIDSDLKALRDSFLNALKPAGTQNVGASVELAMRRLSDPAFVEGPEYADALMQLIPEGIEVALLDELLRTKTVEPKHRQIVDRVFRKLSDTSKKAFISHLATELDQEVPDGRWASSIILLAATARESWALLPKATQIRLENAIINDVLNGRLDIFSPMSMRTGVLGTWAKSLWVYFGNPTELCNAMIALLKNSWYTQNYVAENFFWMLGDLSRVTNLEEACIEALQAAIKNDAKRVKAHLERLPQTWRNRLEVE